MAAPGSAGLAPPFCAGLWLPPEPSPALCKALSKNGAAGRRVPRTQGHKTPSRAGHPLYQAVCEQGLEGVVAKRSASAYRPGQRSWIKVKNPGYWRRDQELESLRRSGARRGLGDKLD
jgi:ATP-dependent DNA ligase